MQVLDHRQASSSDYSGALTPRLPDLFSLDDVNPLTGGRYCESRYEMLPPYAVAAIGIVEPAWNALVDTGTVGLAFNLNRVYPLSDTLQVLRGNQWLVWNDWVDMRPLAGKLCPECLGTLVAHDFDASVTGTRNAPYLCPCWDVPAQTSHTPAVHTEVAA